VKRRQQGVTLIEVMISAVVVSIGLLGVFQLHLVAKRGSYESFQYTQAHALATDIVERMRANPSQLPAYASRDYGVGGFAMPAKSCVNLTTEDGGCAASEMVQWDQHLWHQMLTGGDEMIGDRVIGGASGMRGCVTVSDAAVEVVVSWRGMDETVDGAVGGSAALCGQADARRRSVRIATTIVEGI
jgi:type IV pilus assembly protein PilV